MDTPQQPLTVDHLINVSTLIASRFKESSEQASSRSPEELYREATQLLEELRDLEKKRNETERYLCSVLGILDDIWRKALLDTEALLERLSSANLRKENESMMDYMNRIRKEQDKLCLRWSICENEKKRSLQEVRLKLGQLDDLEEVLDKLKKAIHSYATTLRTT